MSDEYKNKNRMTRTTDRQKALTDGVFAIVMTLLVLELGVDHIVKTATNSELLHGLSEMWPEFLIYGLSFLILGLFWVMHHALYDIIVRLNFPSAWINILFLMFVSLIPFSTSLVGRFGMTEVTALFYGANMFLLFFLGFVTWAYATGKKRLVEEDLDLSIIRSAKNMGLIYCMIMLPALCISFINPVVAFSIYGFITIAFISATMIGREELVMTWRPSQDRD